MVIVWILVAMTLVAIVASQFSADKRLKRQLASTPRTPIGHAGGGLTKIVGQLGYCYPPLVAPISGRHCAAYQVLVEELEVELLNPAKRKMVPIIHEIRGQPFLLYDETGRAFVAYDEQTGLLIKRDVDLKSGTLRDATPAMEALLNRYGHSSTRIFGMNKGIRYYEGVLEAGEWVTVIGMASRELDPDPNVIAAAAAAGYPSPPTWVVVRAAPGVELRVTDDVPPAPPPPLGPRTSS